MLGDACAQAGGSLSHVSLAAPGAEEYIYTMRGGTVKMVENRESGVLGAPTKDRALRGQSAHRAPGTSTRKESWAPARTKASESPNLAQRIAQEGPADPLSSQTRKHHFAGGRKVVVGRGAASPPEDLRKDDAPVYVRWVVGVGSEKPVTVGFFEADPVTNLVAGQPVDLQV